MCGIVGYIGTKKAAPILLEGLAALEYRGYDSAGLYVVGHGTLKRAGKVNVLCAAVPDTIDGRAGIAHTRWATHGPPTETNAHPHTDSQEQVWLVHNGIIENYAEIRARLSEDGIPFYSDTDTEVLAALVGYYYRDDVLIEEAVSKALADIRGTYGIAVASVREPEKVVIARKGSPLMIGIGTNEYFIASDATPILPHTRNVIYLEDSEIAILTKDSHRITNLDNVPLEKKPELLEWNIEAAQKRGYPHFMLKEIQEIPEVLTNALRGRIDPEKGTVHLGGLNDVAHRLQKLSRIIITGCGSAYYAGLAGELLIEELAGIPVEVEIASELRYRKWTADPAQTVLIAVSQSGETADTLEAVREAKRQGILTLGIVNVVGSSIARETDAGVFTHAGPEIGVASTKAFVAQMAVFALVSCFLKQLRSAEKDTEMTYLLSELRKMPAYARQALDQAEHISLIAMRHAGMRDALFVGRKFQFPIAYEGALKLKEISYVHAEAYGAGEMKHGPLALIDQRFPTIALMPNDSVYEKTRSNVEEIRARSGPIIIVTTEDTPDLSSLSTDVIRVPKTHEALLPLLTVLPLQLFSYFVARERDCPIDMPRNLAKSVTVE